MIDFALRINIFIFPFLRIWLMIFYYNLVVVAEQMTGAKMYELVSWLIAFKIGRKEHVAN